jgi:DNA-binding NarL/FixJ family response regulator
VPFTPESASPWPPRNAFGRFVAQPSSRPAKAPPRPLGIDGKDSPVWDLAPRHVKALDLAADGITRHEIAHRLNVPPGTVKEWFKSAARILGTGNPTAMVAECYLAGVFARRPADDGVPELPGALALLLPLSARGLSYAQIGAELGWDYQEVKGRVSALYRALGAAGAVHVPRRAVDLGLLTPRLELAAPAAPAAPKPSKAAPPAAKPERAEPPVNPLSPAEEQVLRLIAFGFELDAIATRLKIGPGAVRENARSAMAKLGARTLPNAVFLACGAGILSGPGGGRND